MELVRYYGVFFDTGDVETCLRQAGIRLAGDLRTPLHMTMQYYGYEAGADRSSLPAADLGTFYDIAFCAEGLYFEGGRLENQGLLADDASLVRALLSDGRSLRDVCKNAAAHLTLCVLGSGLARNTSLCRWKKTQEIILRGRLGIYTTKGRVLYTLPD